MKGAPTEDRIFSLSIQKTLILTAPGKMKRQKKFCSFVKSLKKTRLGSLRANGILKTDTVDKANICNKQFQSAFTRETDSEIPSKGTSPFTDMGEITQLTLKGSSNC